MLTKKQVLETIDALPEDKFRNIENVIEEIILLDKVEKGLREVKEGNTFSEEEANKEMDKW
jgi:predicted transcriptional regulator